MPEKIGIIDVGGGFRGVYAAGLFDYCMDRQLHFDMGIGVSAGSANLISFMAGQVRRNYKFYTEYGLRKEYAGFMNFLRKRSFIDLDYAYGTLSNSDGENPLDYAAVRRNPMEFLIVATEAETGNVRYFDISETAQDDYNILKASCALPYVCHPYEVKGVPYYDGALSDPVPVEKAFACGCDRVVLILTLPRDTVRDSEQDNKVARRIEKKYPHAAAKLRNRANQYNKSVELAKEYEKQGKLLLVAPDDTCGVHTLCREPEPLNALYRKGYKDGEKIEEFLRK